MPNRSNFQKEVDAKLSEHVEKINRDESRYLKIDSIFKTGPDDQHKGLELCRIIEGQVGQAAGKAVPNSILNKEGRHVIIYRRNNRKLYGPPDRISGYIVLEVQMKSSDGGGRLIAEVLHSESFDNRSKLMEDLDGRFKRESVKLEGFDTQALIDLDELMLEFAKEFQPASCEIRNSD